MDLENKISAQSEAKWKVQVEHVIEDLEASKLSVHNLLQDNLCLKTLLQHSAEESDRILEETKLGLQQKVTKMVAQSDWITIKTYLINHA